MALVILFAAIAQLALNAYLYGESSLNGERPPFLTARVIADGPGRWYLEQHCPEAKLAICNYVHDLPDDPDNFLWGSDGIWQNADDAMGKRLRREEIPFVLATLRAYPRQQLSKSAVNFWYQLKTFDMWDLGANGWILEVFDPVFPGDRQHYLQSRQVRDALPLEFFAPIQDCTIIASLVVIGVFAPLLWFRRPTRLIGLSVVIVSMVVANALFTGPLSMVEDRFESRVIWLLPFLSGLLLLECLEHWLVHHRLKQSTANS